MNTKSSVGDMQSMVSIRPLDHDSYIPLYMQAEMFLRELIQDPQYHDGKLLPDEVALADGMGVSRNTVRQAMDRLVHEGVLSRKKGVGTRVAFHIHPINVINSGSFSEELNRDGVSFTTTELHAEWTAAPVEIADFFTIDNRRPVLRVSWNHHLERGGIVCAVVWVHPRITLSGSEDYSDTSVESILEQAGLRVKWIDEEIRSRGAETKEAHKIDVRPAAHVFERKRTYYDAQDRPLAVSKEIFDAELFTFSARRDLF